MKSLRIVVLLVVVAASAARGEVVRWINAAGGEWGVGANWDRGTPPGVGNTARFDLQAAYTVTLTQDVDVMGWNVLAYEQTTFEMIGRTVRVGVPQSAGGSLTVSGNVRLHGGTIILVGQMPATISGNPMICEPRTEISDRLPGGWRAGSVSVSGVVTNFGTFTRNVTAAGQFTQCGFGGESVSVSGLLTGGGVGGEIISIGPGEMIGGSASAADGATIVGPILLRAGATVNQFSFGTFVRGSVVVDEGASIHRIEGFTDAQIEVRDTGRIQGQFTLGNSASLVLRPGSRADGTINLRDAARLRVEHGVSGVFGLAYWPGQSGMRTELVLDGTQSPPIGPRVVFENTLGGSLVLEAVHPNGLRVGDEFKLFNGQYSGPFTGAFASVQTPDLGGGRALQVMIVPSHVVARVEAGGEPCWGPDFDGDGVDGTDADIEAFFECLAGRCCALCGSVDFNSDGDTATDADIEAFFRVLAGEAC